MSPRPKTYDTEEERAEAHRRRQQKYLQKKRSLRQKLSELINGNGEAHSQDTPPSSNTPQPKKTVKVVMDTQQNQLGFNSSDKIGSEANSNRVLTNCVWCGKLCTSREMVDGKCGFCSQFESKEEMMFMLKVSSRLAILPSDVSRSQKERFWNEALSNYRKQYSRGESNE